jgi:DNA-binding transcriptional LysR family regulator
MSDGAGNYHQVLRQCFEAEQLPAPRTQAMGSVEGVKRGILAGGLALGLLPAHAVAQELRDGVLIEIAIGAALPPLFLRAVVARAAASSPIVEDLLAHLRTSPLTS